MCAMIIVPVCGIIDASYKEMYFRHYPNGPYKCSICGKLLNRNSEDLFVKYVPSKSKDNTKFIDKLQLICLTCKLNEKPFFSGLIIR